MARKRNCTCIYCLHRAAVKATNRDDLAQRFCVARITAWGRTNIQGEEIQDLADWSYTVADAMIARGAKPT